MGGDTERVRWCGIGVVGSGAHSELAGRGDAPQQGSRAFARRDPITLGHAQTPDRVVRGQERDTVPQHRLRYRNCVCGICRVHPQ